MSDNTVTASAYLVVKADRAYGWRNPETGLRAVSTAKITASRQARPGKLGVDEVLIKVSVQLPKGVFDPITPEALIVVPEDLILDRGEIEAVAVEGGSDE